MKSFLLLFGCLLVAVHPALSWGNSNNKDRVLLTDISSITLEAGKMTNGRRSSPVPQLKCVGGTAGYSAPQPKIVQCLNRGSDGYDVQWECKADMDYDYRFGRIQVSCEGYDNPNDPYILRGSCGLEYELDYTEQGRNRQHGGGGGGYYHDNYQGSYGGSYNYGNDGSIRWGKIVSLVVMGTIVYWLYKCCISGGGRRHTTSNYASSGSSMGSGAGMGSGYTGGNTGGGGGGFWTGAATGGLLGYMFGNRGTGYGGGYGRSYGPSWGGGYTRSSGGWGSSGWSSGGGWGSSSRSSSRSGSRSTSGFGGTSRR